MKMASESAYQPSANDDQLITSLQLRHSPRAGVQLATCNIQPATPNLGGIDVDRMRWKAVNPFMKKPRGCSRSVWTAVVLVCATALMQGETHYVFVDDSGFSPSDLTIQVGDTVQWENVDEFDFPHTTTSTLTLLDPDHWDGYLPGTGDTFAKTFNNPGEFHYYDKVDVGVGMITVTSVAAPTITLAAPRVEAGLFLFEATGLTPGKTNVLLASTHLTTWTAVSTNLSDSATVTFTNAVTSGWSYYRVMELE